MQAKRTTLQPNGVAKAKEPALVASGIFLLLILYFWPATMGGQVLIPADILYTDPVWQSSKPSGFTVPQNPLMSDYIWNFYPVQFFVQNELHHGRLALWNPYIFSGTPSLASAQWSILDPINLVLLRLLSIYSVPGWSAVLRLFIASLGMYALMRSWKVSTPGSLVAALAFILGGAVILDLGYPIVATIAWLPWCLLLTGKTLSASRRGRWFFLGALALGLQFLAGDPQGSLYVVLVTCLYGLAVALRQSSSFHPLLQRLVVLAALVVVGVALASIQLIPFGELVLVSQYLVDRVAGAQDQPLVYTRFWYDSIKGVTLFLPNLLGNPTRGNLWVGNAILDYTLTCYMGSVPLFLALAGGWRQRKDWRVAFFGGAAIVALLVMLRWPVFDWISRLPLINLSHSGRSFQEVYCFSIAIVAGFGLDALLEPEARQTLKRLVLVLFGYSVLGAVGLGAIYAALFAFRDKVLALGAKFVEDQVYGHPPHPFPLEYYLAQLNERYRQVLNVLDPFQLALYLPLCFALCGAVVLWAAWKQTIRPSMAKVLIVLLVVVDLVTFGWGFNVSIPRDQVLPWTPALRFLSEHQGYHRLASLGALPNNTGVPFALYNYRGNDIITARTFLGVDRNLELEDGIPTDSSHNQRLYDLMGVRYFLTAEPLTSEAKPVYDKEIKIYERPTASSRAFLANSFEVMSAPPSLLARLDDPAVASGHHVLLEEAPPTPIASAGAGGHGTVSILTYQADRVALAVDCAQASLLVLTDTFYPGWNAFVDGQDTRVLRADYMYRAVVVPAGQHEVAFVYRPVSFQVGAWISGISFAILALVTGWMPYRDRKGQMP